METENEISKWGPIKSQEDDDLKKIAKDLYNGLIFTDRQAGGNVSSSFMVLLFMGPQPPSKPKYPNDNDSLQNGRDNALYDILQRDIDNNKYDDDMILYESYRKEFQEKQLTSIGLVYEYLDKAGPMAINGLPIFYSLRLLNKTDTDKMFDYYFKYKDIREKVDNF